MKWMKKWDNKKDFNFSHVYLVGVGGEKGKRSKK